LAFSADFSKRRVASPISAWIPVPERHAAPSGNNVNTHETTTVDLLLRVTGGRPLLSYDQLAAVLDRSPKGLRTILCQDNELSRKLLPAARKIGRRRLFSVLDVARFLDESGA